MFVYLRPLNNTVVLLKPQWERSAGDFVTRRSWTGFLVYIQNTQSGVKALPFSSDSLLLSIIFFLIRILTCIFLGLAGLEGHVQIYHYILSIVSGLCVFTK